MANTFETFEHAFLGCFNIGSCVNLFKVIINHNQHLTEKERKDLLDNFGVALKGKHTRTIRKSLERICQYSASPSTKSKTILSDEEKTTASSRLINFLQMNEHKWASEKLTKQLFLFFLTQLLADDPLYENFQKRPFKRQLDLASRHFFKSIAQDKHFNDDDYYEILTAYLTELLGNPNRHNFADKYTLYGDSGHLAFLAKEAAKEERYAPDPYQLYQQWQANLQDTYTKIYYQLTHNDLPLSDSLYLTEKERRELTWQKLKEDSPTDFFSELAILPNTRLKTQLINALKTVAPRQVQFKTFLSQKRHLLITNCQSNQQLRCPFIKLDFKQLQPTELPNLSFKLIESTMLEVANSTVEKQVAQQLRLNTANPTLPPLNSYVPCLIEYSAEHQSFYYQELDYYISRGRELLWQHPAIYWQLTQAPAQTKTALEEMEINAITNFPTSLSDSFPVGTPFYAELNLLLKTNDQHVILSTQPNFLDGTTLLEFSYQTPLHLSDNRLEPLAQLAKIITTDFKQTFKSEQLDSFTVGLDCQDYRQQLIYTYSLDLSAAEILEHVGSYSDNKLFALPLKTNLIFQLLRQFSANPGLSYTLLTLTNLSQPKSFNFKKIDC